MSSDKPEEPGQEPEEIESLAASDAASVVDSIDRNRSKIITLIVGAALAICAYLVVGQLKTQKHLEAAAAFTEALDKKEIAAFDAILVEYPGSIAAGNALLSKAELQIDQGKPGDAQATLEQFVSEFTDHPRYPQGLFGLANLFHVSGDAEKATDFYNQTIAAQPDGELTPLTRIRLGDLALEAGDKETADQLYQESYTAHPGNPFFNYAEDKIAMLNIGNPPVVNRPEPEPEPKPEVESAPKAEKEAKPGAPAPDAKPKAKAKAKSPGKAPAKPKADQPKDSKPKGKANAPKQGKANAKSDPKPKAEDSPKAPE